MPTPCDDRSNPCSVARLTNRQLAWRALGIKSLTRDELIKQEQQVTLNTEVGIAIGGGFVGWVIWSMVILPFTSLKGTLLGNLFIPVVFSVVISTAIWFLSLSYVRQRLFSRIAGIHLGHGRCAGCGYDLHDLPVEPDGCLICPECSAAWRADRVSPQRESSPDA